MVVDSLSVLSPVLTSLGYTQCSIVVLLNAYYSLYMLGAFLLLYTFSKLCMYWSAMFHYTRIILTPITYNSSSINSFCTHLSTGLLHQYFPSHCCTYQFDSTIKTSCFQLYLYQHCTPSPPSPCIQLTLIPY